MMGKILKGALYLAILTAASGAFAPGAFPFVAALSLWPSFVFGLIVIAVAFLLRGHVLHGGAGLAAAAAILSMIAPHYRPSPVEVSAEDADITIVWANIHSNSRALADAVALAEDEGAEVLAIGEWDFTADHPEGWKWRCGPRPVVIYTRGEATRCEVVDGLPPSAERCVHPSQTWGGVRLDGPLCGGRLRRAPQMIRLEIDGRPVTIMAAHLTMPLMPTAPFVLPFGRTRGRNLEFETLLEEPVLGPVLLVGDFNTAPWSPLFESFPEARLHRASTGPHNTWGLPPFFLGLPIDQAFASDHFEASAEVGPWTRSDHRPVILRARFIDPEG